MLAAIAERIAAFGPRFRLPLQTVQAVEAQAGRKKAVAFAREHEDLTVKAMGVVLADVVLGTRLLAELISVTSKRPPNQRKLKQLRRRLDKVLARIEKEIA
jgi:hypothetical protein